MQTETILLDTADGTWRSVLVGSDGYIVITEMTHPILVKVGISSQSAGFKLNPGDILKVGATIYIKPNGTIHNAKTRVVVNR